jgi:hypothetical protein
MSFLCLVSNLEKGPHCRQCPKKNWSCDPSCPLCFCVQETNDHLLTECNFSEAVWDNIAADCHLHPTIVPFQKGDITGWLESITRAGSKTEQQTNAGIVFFF